jgi:hypothetical protein
MTRPDIAFAASLLTFFATNPSSTYRDEADRTVDYLINTKYYSIEYSAKGISGAYIRFFKPDAEPQPQTLIVASDAAFGDNLPTRRSSEGYVIHLFGGLIDWKAGRQTSVTTSSTEAELLSLSHAATQLIWWSRLFKQLGFKLGHKLKIYCDNKQTVDFMEKKTSKLKTRLRHVDIHQHWLRERV